MSVYNISNLHIGLKVMQDDEPCIVLKNEFVKPGKGQAFNRVRLRNLISGKILERTFKSSDYAKLANVLEITAMYLYCNNTLWYFMNIDNFEQIIVDAKVIGHNYKWLFNQINCILTLWNKSVIYVALPNFVTLQVMKTSPEVKGKNYNTSCKLATLTTGVVVKVPLFIKVGDFIKLDTRSGEYLLRKKVVF